MTAINVSATIAQTLTPTGPSEIKVVATGLGGLPQTLALGTPSDGKSWYFVKGTNNSSGTIIKAVTISGATLTLEGTANAVNGYINSAKVETLVLHVVRA